MQMGDERIPKKVLHTKMMENDKEEGPEPDGWPNQKGYRNEKEKLGRNTRKQEVRE